MKKQLIYQIKQEPIDHFYTKKIILQNIKTMLDGLTDDGDEVSIRMDIVACTPMPAKERRKLKVPVKIIRKQK
jgi:hypothetical protein